MRKIISFNMISMDGFFEGPNQEIDWHHVDQEFNEFAAEQLDSADRLLFGRVTYELMANYWPTPAALQDDPIIASKMNSMHKTVFSKTLQQAAWANTDLVQNLKPEEIRDMKEKPGKDILVFGSNRLGIHLLKKDLMDEIRLMIAPVALSRGHSLFEGLEERLEFRLVNVRNFRSGNVLLYYQPIVKGSHE